MCYHVSNTKKATDFKQHLNLNTSIDFNEKYTPFYHASGFDRPLLPVILVTSGGPKIELFTFGLIPEWANFQTYKANTLNARNDELFDKISYQNYWKNRCLVIVTGFFEPHTPLSNSKHSSASNLQKTESWFIKPKLEPFLTLGGIYCNQTVAIITTHASPLMAKIHNDGKRQPLILDSVSLRDQWLTNDISQNQMVQLMMHTPDDTHLEAYRTMDGIMNSRINTNVPEAILPYIPPANASVQLSIFD